MAEFDQVVVCGWRGQASDVEVGFTQLFPASGAAAAAVVGATVGARAGRSHGVRRRGNEWLEREQIRQVDFKSERQPKFDSSHFMVTELRHYLKPKCYISSTQAYLVTKKQNKSLSNCGPSCELLIRVRIIIWVSS